MVRGKNGCGAHQVCIYVSGRGQNFTATHGSGKSCEFGIRFKVSYGRGGDSPDLVLEDFMLWINH